MPGPEQQPLQEMRTQAQAVKEIQNLREIREMFTGAKPDLERRFFGVAENAGELVKDVTARLNENNPTYQQRKQWAIILMQRTGLRLYEEKLRQLTARGKTKEETREQLRDLAENYWRTIEQQHHAVKMEKQTFSPNPNQESFEHTELVAFNRFLTTLDSMKADELETVIFENAHIADMVQEAQTGKPVKIPGKSEDDQPKFRMLDPYNPDYLENLNALRAFILGKPGQDEFGYKDQEKSKFRQQTELLMWQEVVRGMDDEQKWDLLVTFFNNSAPHETKQFIQESIIAGVMSRKLLLELQEHNPQAQELFKELALGDPKFDFKKFVDDSVRLKDQGMAAIDKAVTASEKQQVQNAVTYFFTFNKLGIETVGRIGALTAVINATMDVMDAITNKGDKGMAKAIAEGLGSAARNKFVWGGAAVAALASDVIHPWIKDFAYSPSGKEKTREFSRRADLFLKEQADNHAEIVTFFQNKYEDYCGIAARNEANADPEKKRGTFDLWPNDIEITAEEAGEAGFESADAAKAVIIQMFGICARENEPKIRTYLGITKYLRTEKLLPKET